MCNFAAPDMVGHTGQYEPAVKACTATGIMYDSLTTLVLLLLTFSGTPLIITRTPGAKNHWWVALPTCFICTAHLCFIFCIFTRPLISKLL